MLMTWSYVLMLKRHVCCVYWEKHHTESSTCMSYVKVQVIRDVMLDYFSQLILVFMQSVRKKDGDHMLTKWRECRGVWMEVMLLYVASCIIFPIIFKEGIRAVFMPFLVRKPQVRT
jgi:hypothetical protein